MDNPENLSTENAAGASTTPKPDDNHGIRDDLVNTAVRFLQTPKVRQTPLSHRKAFLAKKGLNDAEIQEAINHAGPAMDDQSAMIPYQQQMMMAPSPRPTPVTWRDYANAMMLVGGASYVAYNVVRRYVLPSWFNIPDPEQERLRRLDENMNDVQNGLKFLVDSVQQTLGVVQQQQETLNRLVHQLIEKDKSTATQERAIQELRTELATIKSLLLSRDQFPPLPTISHQSAPIIPAWQLNSNSRHPVLNGDHRNNSKFMIGMDDDDVSADGYPASEEPYVSATGSENGEKTTPV